MSEGLRLGRAALGALPPEIVGPGYDVAAVTPGIVHVGLGGFHRAHMARYTHDLMERDLDGLAWGIVGASLRDADRPLLAALARQDGLYTLLERKGDAEDRTVIGALAGVINASAGTAELLAAIGDPAVRIVSLTVTENGYHLERATRQLDLEHPDIRRDLLAPADPRTAIGVLVEAYRRRREAAAPAFTTLCCDNIPHNGDILRTAVLAFATALNAGLAAWIAANACFPNSMVDRITPVADPAVSADLHRRFGVADDAALISEQFRQWVIEDRFSAGRPCWELVGAQFVDDVTPYEVMKLRLLNGSHLAIAGLGQLAGYAHVHEALADPLICGYMATLMDREVGPLLRPVPGIDLDDYRRTLLARFANPAIRDTVARVNRDAPLNMLVDPVRDSRRRGRSVPLLSLALAAWLRRVRGEDDAGRPLAVEHPLADELRRRAVEGGVDPVPLLSLRPLFGDLVDDAELVEAIGEWLGSLYESGTRRTLAMAAARFGF